jgi:hypothetical protein
MNLHLRAEGAATCHTTRRLSRVIEEWAAMVERLYGTATPTASTDPADERAASEQQPT